MSKDEVIKLIKRNRNTKREAIVLISDFLNISKSDAVKIYREEFDDNE